jgi:hypothetical protein
MNADVVDAVPADRDVVADDYVPEDADDVVAGQGDEPVEEPVAAAAIAAPLRRSKRVAAQLCRTPCSEVAREVVPEVTPEIAPSICATSGRRRSARLATKPRVNYTPFLACR